MANVEAGHREMDPLFYTISVQQEGRTSRKVVVAPEISRTLKEEIHEVLSDAQNAQHAPIRFGPERHPGEIPVTTCNINSGLNYSAGDTLDKRTETARNAVEQVLGSHGLAFTFTETFNQVPASPGTLLQPDQSDRPAPGIGQPTLF